MKSFPAVSYTHLDVYKRQDAYRCFMRTEIDLLVLEDCLLWKEQQPPYVYKRQSIPCPSGAGFALPGMSI